MKLKRGGRTDPRYPHRRARVKPLQHRRAVPPRRLLDGPAALLVGAAGAVAAEQFLGVVDTESDSDIQLASDHWQTLFDRGWRQQIIPTVGQEVWALESGTADPRRPG